MPGPKRRPVDWADLFSRRRRNPPLRNLEEPPSGGVSKDACLAFHPPAVYMIHIVEEIEVAMRKGDNLGEFEHLVLLSLVRLGDKAYGVPIRQELSERTGRDVSVGAVYTTLERMEKKGFVSSRQGEPTAERGGRAKKYFRIEAAGQLALESSWKALVSMRKGVRQAPAGAT